MHAKPASKDAPFKIGRFNNKLILIYIMGFIENQKSYFRTLKGEELICIGCGIPIKSKNDATFSYLWAQPGAARVVPPVITAYHKKCFDSMKKEISGLSIMYTPATIEAEKIPSYLRFVKFVTLGTMIIPLLLLIAGAISLGVLITNFFFPGNLSSFYNISGVSGILLTLFFLFFGITIMYFIIANLITVKKIKKFVR